MFLVLSVAPMGIIGVVAALLLAHRPLGFVAILGVLALTGMIARNSVILIHQIEEDKAKGLHPWDAVVGATLHRVRPILLTAAAAILGDGSDRDDRLLGSDGLRDHGGPRDRDGSDPRLPSGALCGVVPHQEA